MDVYHRILFKDDGTAVDIFQIRSWAIILISVIIGLHIMGLIILAVYAGYRPTWTDSFDAFSMLRIGAHIPETEGQNARLLVSGHIRYAILCEFEFLDDMEQKYLLIYVNLL